MTEQELREELEGIVNSVRTMPQELVDKVPSFNAQVVSNILAVIIEAGYTRQPEPVLIRIEKTGALTAWNKGYSEACVTGEPKKITAILSVADAQLAHGQKTIKEAK